MPCKLVSFIACKKRTIYFERNSHPHIEPFIFSNNIPSSSRTLIFLRAANHENLTDTSNLLFADELYFPFTFLSLHETKNVELCRSVSNTRKTILNTKD